MATCFNPSSARYQCGVSSCSIYPTLSIYYVQYLNILESRIALYSRKLNRIVLTAVADRGGCTVDLQSCLQHYCTRYCILCVCALYLTSRFRIVCNSCVLNGKPTSRSYGHGTEAKTIQPITARKIILQPMRMLRHGTVTTRHEPGVP